MKEVHYTLMQMLSKPTDFWDLLSRNKYLLKDFIFAINDLYEDGLINVKNGKIYLTEKGKRYVKNVTVPGTCKSCGGKHIEIPKEFKKWLVEFKKAVKNRPEVSGKFYQEWMYPEEVIARIAYMHFHNDFVNKDFFLVGDDDLLSIALAVTNHVGRIFVVDIDPLLIEYIERTARKNRWSNVEAMVYDVGNPLPKNLLKKFDVFSSEPLETWSGLKAFFLRGMLSLRLGGSGYVGITNVEASLEKWRKVEEFVSSRGFVVTDIVRDFSLYPYSTGEYNDFTSVLKFKVSKPKPWYKSSLFRIKKIEDVELENPKIKIQLTDEDSSLSSPTLS